MARSSVDFLIVTTGVILTMSSVISANECNRGNDEYLWDPTLKECLRIAGPGDPLKFKCKSNLQCTKSSLGRLSRCSPETSLCECYDTITKGKGLNPTVVFEQKCYIRRKLGDFCTDDIACKAGIHPAAVCSHSSEFLPHETVCVCPEGQSCKVLGDACQSDKECQLGLGRNAECVMKIGDLQCECKEGTVCGVDFVEEVSKSSAVVTVGIVAGVVAGILILVVGIVKLVRSRRRGRDNSNNFRRVSSNEY